MKEMKGSPKLWCYRAREQRLGRDAVEDHHTSDVPQRLRRDVPRFEGGSNNSSQPVLKRQPWPVAKNVAVKEEDLSTAFQTAPSTVARRVQPQQAFIRASCVNSRKTLGEVMIVAKG